jgi:hypothetical protein
MRTWSILIFVTLLLVVLPLTSLPQSQPPSPGPLKTSQEQQNKSEAKQEESKYFQNAPDKTPLVVKAPTPSIDHKKANNAERTDKQSSADWWRILFDFLLTLFTGILAWSTVKLWRCTEKSSDLTYKAFIATNRPRLRIRRILSHGIAENEVLPTWIYVTNIGGSKATDIEFKTVYAMQNGYRRREPWIEKLPDSLGHGPSELAPGETQPYQPMTDFSFEAGDFEGLIGTRQTFLIIGTVGYRDDNKTRRETGFGWTYSGITGEFCKPEKEDQYNYED